MALTQEQFDALVSKLETFSKQHPGSYRLRVGLFAALGYVYIFLVLAGLLALIGLVVLIVVFSHHVSGYLIKLFILLLIPAWVIVRSLWVKFPSPEGLRLNRHQVPQLFALVDELTTRLQAPRFHNILLNQDFNASVVQIPRLGIFGWQENYLLLGLPLMQSLSLEQLKAVLAHELGHLSGNHCRFAGWIYRVRKTWMQIYERLHQSNQSGLAVLFNRFLDWYWPAFDAYSFVLARMNEYEADRCAAQLAGARHTAEALISIEVKARFLENSFWSEVHKQVEQQPDPPPDTYSSMLTVLHRPIEREQSHQWLEQALVQKTSTLDTHPCLADRLRSLGYSPTQAEQLPQPGTIQISAAEQLLGETLHQIATQFDQDWQVTVATSWRQRYAYLQETQSKLQALEKKAQTQRLTVAEAWERACYTGEVRGSEAAMPLLQDVLTQQPDHPEANYALGQLWLQQDDAAGIACIETAIAQKVGWVIDGCELIYGFYVRQGQPEAAQKYQERAEQHYQQLLKAQQERASVSDRDQFKPHTLTAAEVTELKQQLAAYGQVKIAYLVEKVVTYFPEERFLVLGIVRNRNWVESETAAQQFVDRLCAELQFPTQAYVIILNHSSSGRLKKQMEQVERSLIFRRS